MVKITKGKTPTPSNENDPSLIGITESGTTPTNLKALAKAFAPVVELRAAKGLKVNPRNARSHSPRQVQQIAASVREFGWVAPIVVDEDDTVLAGHGRLRAALLLNMEAVPTIQVKHLTPERKRAFMLADNRLAELAEWDEELLTIELKELSGLEFDFDFEVTGFETRDLDRLEGPVAAKPAKAEVVPELDRAHPPVSSPGDLWTLGSHLLLCGNALEEASYAKLMGEQRAQMVFTDPPYNVKIDGHVCGLGSVHHKPFELAAGEMSESEFVRFLATAMGLMAQYSGDGAIHDICMDWRHLGEVLAAAKDIYSEQKNLCVWNKTNAGMGAFYRSKHEMVLVFKVGTAPHVNNFGLGAGGRYRTNVWDYAGVNTFKRGRMDELRLHPTVKPLPLVVDALKDCSTRRGVVLDPFVGSGTTLLAAEKTGRIGRGIELDPYYVDAAIGRWQALTGELAVHVESGRTFDQMPNPPIPVADAA
jgi:DNA modification methylase